MDTLDDRYRVRTHLAGKPLYRRAPLRRGVPDDVCGTHPDASVGQTGARAGEIYVFLHVAGGEEDYGDVFIYLFYFLCKGETVLTGHHYVKHAKVKFIFKKRFITNF